MRTRSTVLVTGGTGFIGRSLVDALLARGYFVKVIGRRPVIGWRARSDVEHLRADISEPGVLEAAVQNADQIFHLAAATSGTPEFYQRVTIESTERLLELVAGRGARVVFVSSASVYDAGSMKDASVIDEDFPLERNTQLRGLYARAKTESELGAQEFLSHPRVKLTVVRPGLVYGPRSDNVLNGAALSVRRRILITTGTPAKLLPLIYVDDLVDGLIRIAESEAAIGRVYNIAHPQMPTTEQFLRTYRELSGDRRPMIDIPLPKLLPVFSALDKLSASLGRQPKYRYSAGRLVSGSTFSSDRIRREMGFEPRVGFREGLEKVYGN